MINTVVREVPMTAQQTYPQLLQVVLDTTDARGLAEFYRQLLGWRYRPGHEEPDPNGDDWLVLQDADGRARCAARAGARARGPAAGGPLRRSGRAAARVRRPGRPSVLHLRRLAR